MKIWDKGFNVDDQMIQYTVGEDYILDLELIKYDCIASIAHANMLKKIGLLTENEASDIIKTLEKIKESNCLTIELKDEDCHTAIENFLIKEIGEAGKKIHTARSRNDQVLTALRLYEKDMITKLQAASSDLIETLFDFSKKYESTPLPGYTHMRKAMPSSIPMWAGCFIEALKDDQENLDAVFKIIDKSPLGTAAGYGVPVFEIDREMTQKELGFAKKIENPIYAQLTRGKFEGNIINACAQVMLTLNKISNDIILFSMTEFDLMHLPKEMCTGSSIMPQKMNPDILEIMRGKYHEVLGFEFQIKSLIGNLISGYNRDAQLTKKPLMSSLTTTLQSVQLMNSFIKGLSINEKACEESMTDELYAVEYANTLVKQGMPFRDAYKEVAKKFTK